jgi:hypothetical protein
MEALRMLGRFLESERARLSDLDLQVRYGWRDVHAVASSLLAHLSAAGSDAAAATATTTAESAAASPSQRRDVAEIRELLERLASPREDVAAEEDGGAVQEYEEPTGEKRHREELDVDEVRSEKRKKKSKKEKRNDDPKKASPQEKECIEDSTEKRSSDKKERKEARKKAKKEAKRAKREKQKS